LCDRPRNRTLVGHTNDEAVFSREVGHKRSRTTGSGNGQAGTLLSPALRSAALAGSPMAAAWARSSAALA
jgi:hypothetical protein